MKEGQSIAPWRSTSGRWARHAAVAVAAGALLSWGLAGCTGSLNQSDQLLGAPPLPALSAPTEPTLPPNAGDPSLTAANGLDRRGWPVVVAASPRGQVQSQPTYVTTLFPDRSTARARGEFPTGASVAQTGGAWDAQAWEGTANAFGSPLFILSAPVEMLMGNWWWITVIDKPEFVRVPPDSGRDPWIWIEPPAAGSAPAAPPAATTTAGATASRWQPVAKVILPAAGAVPARQADRDLLDLSGSSDVAASLPGGNIARPRQRSTFATGC